MSGGGVCVWIAWLLTPLETDAEGNDEGLLVYQKYGSRESECVQTRLGLQSKRFYRKTHKILILLKKQRVISLRLMSVCLPNPIQSSMRGQNLLNCYHTGQWICPWRNSTEYGYEDCRGGRL